MRKYINKEQYTLEELKEAKRKAKHKEKNKLQIIILLYKGKRVAQISKYMGISEPTIYGYIDKYNEGGLRKLVEVHYCERGRKPKLKQTEIEELKEIIKKAPQEIGYGESTNWSTLSIAEYIKHTYSVEMTRSGVREMLVRNRRSYTRPTYVLAKADPKKQELFKSELEELKKT